MALMISPGYDSYLARELEAYDRQWGVDGDDDVPPADEDDESEEGLGVARPFSRGEIFSTLRSLAGAYADFQAAYECLCQQPAVDVGALFLARKNADMARRALDVHARRLLPHIAPTISTDACERLAAWLVREARDQGEGGGMANC